jgi:phosphoserine phosphatase
VFPVAVEETLSQLKAGDRVVFDADGTLWRGDVGEDFLRSLAHDGVVPSDAYSRYEAVHAQDVVKAYAFAVQVMAGLEESRVISLANAFFTQRYAGRIFPAMRAMVGRLHRLGCEVWVCSASPVWPVVPGAAALGVAAARVVGVHCELRDGELTDAVSNPVSAGPGKVHWLERALGRPAALAVGNGDLDLDMLAWAQRALVIGTPDGPDNHLVREAQRRKWALLRL